MNQSFECPACKGVLQFDGGDSIFQICRHCKGKIIIPSSAVHQAQDQRLATDPQMERRNLKLAEINSELRAGQTINAIKIFREAFGTDLMSAKEAIEAMQDGDFLRNADTSLPTPRERSYPNQSASPAGARSALIIIWDAISIGIAVLAIFLSD